MPIDDDTVLAFVGKKSKKNILSIQQLPSFSDAVSLSLPISAADMKNAYQFIYPSKNSSTSNLTLRTSSPGSIQLSITPNSLILSPMQHPISPEAMLNILKNFIVKKGNTSMYLTTRPKTKVCANEKKKPQAIAESKELFTAK
ncbi:hypothetical protein BN1002_04068 [Bacillus sp. B-jedd]|nr:hypothetical protein BN1002_04068 [Bacillus sp. B-jedd]